MVTNKTMKAKTNKKKEIKRQNIISLLIGIGIVIFVNIIGNYLYTRIDLTSENRYTLTPATKKLIKEVDDYVYFKVYLEGEMPAGFKKLSKATKEILDEFRAYNNLIEYTFIDPSIDEDKKDLYKILMEKGLKPTTVQVQKTGSASQQMIFAGAIISYHSRDIVIDLLNNQIGVATESVINNSIESLEYALASSIKKITTVQKPKIGLLRGIKGPRNIELTSAFDELSEFYNVQEVFLNEKLKALDNFKALIIAKPDSIFSDKDKFIIDQYIMNGGKVLWFIDGVKANMDSLRFSNEMIGIGQENGIDDMLFKYGVRINKNILLDLNCLQIPFVTGQVGNQPQMSMLPWYYFPLVSSSSNHPIVNNLNFIKTEFISTIDSVNVPGIKKTVLLQSSKYAKALNSPSRINLEISKKQPPEGFFNKSFLPVAMLLEGEFESSFENRLTEDVLNSKEINFKNKSIPTKMIVVADGDIFKNQIHRGEDGKLYPLPLGFDKYIKQSFGNKDFVLNAVNYLCDDSGLLLSRTKKITLRLLDITKTNKSKLAIQVLNIIMPIFIILIIGLAISMKKKNKFSKK